MRFKQNSSLVYGTGLMYGVALFIMLFVAIQVFDKEKPLSAVLILIIGFGYPLLSMIVLNRLPESRRTVTLGEQEVSIKIDSPTPVTIQIPWVKAEHVIFSQKRGDNTTIIVNDEGNVIWFYSSFKARKNVKSRCEALGIMIEKLPELSTRCFYADFDKQISTVSHF